MPDWFTGDDPLKPNLTSFWRVLLVAAFLSSILLLALELFARRRYGLGSPPLFVSDPALEYRLAPNQNLRRFGHRITINSFGMRSAPLLMPRSPGRRRLLVIGDSVVWGGAQLDQAQIATELLRRPDLEVANLGVPSWGPANQLAYLRRFGLVDATDVVLVISSHDSADVPADQPFKGDADRPLHPPPSALFELFHRYVLPRLRRVLPVLKSANTPSPTDLDGLNGVDPRALRSLSELISLLQRSGVRLAVVQHWERSEVEGQLYPGHFAIAEVLRHHQVPVVQAGPLFRSCGPLASLYSDTIHLYTSAGQACLAEAIRRAMGLAMVASPSPAAFSSR